MSLYHISHHTSLINDFLNLQSESSQDGSTDHGGTSLHLRGSVTGDLNRGRSGGGGGGCGSGGGSGSGGSDGLNGGAY